MHPLIVLQEVRPYSDIERGRPRRPSPPAGIRAARWQIRQAGRTHETPLTPCRRILPPGAVWSSKPSLRYMPVSKSKQQIFLTTFGCSAAPLRGGSRFSPYRGKPTLLHRPRVARTQSKT